MESAKSCAVRKMRDASVRHQRREAWRTLTRKSEPTPKRVCQIWGDGMGNGRAGVD